MRNKISPPRVQGFAHPYRRPAKAKLVEKDSTGADSTARRSVSIPVDSEREGQRETRPWWIDD